MTHELGHFIGFYHVTEVFGQLNDVVSDTAECSTPPAQLRNYDRCMDNVMFPILLSGTGINQNLSTVQGRVGRLNPITR